MFRLAVGSMLETKAYWNPFLHIWDLRVKCVIEVC